MHREKTILWLLPLSLMNMKKLKKNQNLKKRKNQSCPKTLNKDLGEASMPYLVPITGKKLTSCFRAFIIGFINSFRLL